MGFNTKITYEDGTVLEKVYRLGNIKKYFRKKRLEDPLGTGIKPLPVTPWLIAMALEETISDAHAITVRCIEIQERT